MIILSYLSGPHLSSQKCKRKAEEWVRERSVWKITAIAGTEGGGREPEVKECSHPLEPEIDPQPIVSKKMGPLVVVQL